MKNYSISYRKNKSKVMLLYRSRSSVKGFQHLLPAKKPPTMAETFRKKASLTKNGITS